MCIGMYYINIHVQYHSLGGGAFLEGRGTTLWRTPESSSSSGSREGSNLEKSGLQQREKTQGVKQKIPYVQQNNGQCKGDLCTQSSVSQSGIISLNTLT